MKEGRRRRRKRRGDNKRRECVKEYGGRMEGWKDESSN